MDSFTPAYSYLLCYAPLVLVVGGFIVFAALTDAGARKRYLRRLDPRPEGERPAYMPATRSQELTAATPAGLVVSIPAVKVGGDDLSRIEGVGPKIKDALRQAGVTTFAQVAAKSADELKAIINAAGISGFNDPTTWPQQARLAAQGQWDALAKLQDGLKGGRKA